MFTFRAFVLYGIVIVTGALLARDVWHSVQPQYRTFAVVAAFVVGVAGFIAGYAFGYHW